MKECKIETCIWEEERTRKTLNKKPLSCKYYIHMIISWLIDDWKAFFGLQLIGQFIIKKIGVSILKRKLFQI